MEKHGSWFLAEVLILVWCGTALGSSWSLPAGGTGADMANAVQQTADGGYIVAGQTSSYGAGGSDAWVLKLNADGAVAWQKTYGDAGNDIANAVQQTGDGGYIVTGSTNSFGAGGSDAWVLKLNADGAVAWQKTYGGAGNDVAGSVQPTADGGYIVAGYTSSYGAGSADAWVLKLNQDGAVAWHKTYGGGGADYAKCVRQTRDGGYVVAGYTSSSGAGGNDAWLLKLDPDGAVIWQKTYGGGSSDLAASVLETADGGYIFVGYTYSYGAGGSDAWVLKLDADGAVIWQKTYGGGSYDFANSVGQAADGGYIVAGWTGSYGAGNYDAWVLKLNTDGSAAWQKTYGGPGDDGANFVRQAADGGYIIAGQTHSFGSGGNDAWVLKLDQQGGIMGCSAVSIDASTAAAAVTYSVPLDSSVVAASASITPADTTTTAATSSATAAKNCSYVPSTAKWQKTYGGTAYDNAASVQQTADGGYVVAGYTNSSGAGDYDIWVLKLGADGAVAWQKTYGGAGRDKVGSVQQTADGGYIVAGYTVSWGAGGNDAWVLKLNASGSVTWQKTYGGVGSDYAYSVRQTADGGYIVAGETDSFGGEYNDAWIIKLNSDGSVAWQKTYGRSYFDVAKSARETADGGYIVVGTSYVDGMGKVWVLKLNGDGSVSWQKTYAGQNISGAVSAGQTADGGFIVAGNTLTAGGGISYAWVLKLNGDGSVAWQKSYGTDTGDNSANSVQQTADGGYVVAGYTVVWTTNANKAWVLKLNGDGSVAWQKTYGGDTSDDMANSVQQTADGGYIVAGYITFAGAGQSEAWVLKLDQRGGIAGCGTIGDSALVAQDTAAIVSSPTYSVIPSSATASNSTATGTATSVTPGTTCSATYADYILHLIFQGYGTGRVTSSPAGLNCTTDCNQSFTSGGTVSLTATPDALAAPGGWSGACNASGQVTMTSDKSCTIKFTTPADFNGTPRFGVVPFAVDFSDASTVTAPTAWLWDFGDNASGSGLSTMHIYRGPGIYTVSHDVTGSGGTAVAKKTDYVTAAACANMPARIAGPLYYGTITEAYAHLSGMALDLQAMEFAEDVVMTSTKTVTLTAGYSCDYGTVIGNAVISGSLTVGGGGVVAVSGITVR